MTDSGSGQRDNQGQQHPGSDDATTRDATSGDDYTPSASWETSRGSSWENTTPYEQYQGPGSYDSGSSTGSGSSASSYGSASPYGSDYQGSAASAGSAADRPAEDGPWPSYPDQSPQGFGQPPSGYSRPSGYASASDPYPQPG
ncbi:MAG TPA: hypothetical protein VFU98_19325, partial [Microlunatus sp.]|nr:hypothetical protein [Microlunatus sp.]